MRNLINLTVLMFGMFTTSHSFAQNDFIFNQYSLSCNLPLFNNNANTITIPGFGVDLTRVMEFHQRFDWTIGIGYNQVFQQTDFYDFTGKNEASKLEIQRIDIGALIVPISIRVYFDKQKSWYFEPGTFAGFTLYGKVHGTQVVEGEEQRFIRTSNSQLSALDAGVLLAFGYQHMGEKMGWFLKPEIRLGMNNVWTEEGNSNSPFISNSFVRIAVGICF